MQRDALKLPKNTGPAANLIFLDPPYGKGLGELALATCLSAGWIAPGALIVWEENAPQDSPEGFSNVDERRYGDTVVTILRAN